MISPTVPMPATILTTLSQLSGYDYSLNSFNRSVPYVSEFGSTTDLYFKYTQLNQFDNTGAGQSTVGFQDNRGRSYVWHSAFKVQLQGAIVQDPGVYVTNDSNLPLTVQSSVSKTFDASGNPYKFFVSYSASQSSGESSSILNARTIRFLDEEAPVLELLPVTDGTNTFILAEGGTPYTDVASEVFPFQFSSKAGTQPLITRAFDAVEEGAVTDKIDRTVFTGFVNSGSWTTGGTPILRVNPITNIVKSSVEIGNAVAGLILTSFSSLNQVYTIRYDVQDSAENIATPLARYIVVKDTMAPVVALPPTQTVIIDCTSLSSPDVRNEQSVKDFLVSDMTAQDALNFDSNLTWNVEITKPNGQNTLPGGTGYDSPGLGATLGLVYPATPNDLGYIVTITATDSSGNTSAPVTRELKIGDTIPPVLTMMGRSVIHDYLRFGTNTTNPPTPPLERDEITQIDYNSTGFSQGGHRMLLASYGFVDPGVYAEDQNANWSVDEGYPDWDGDGIGEGYESVSVDPADRGQMETCSYQGTPTPFKIHVATTFKSTSIKELQDIMVGNSFGFPASVKTPKTDSSDPVNGYAFTDSNKDANSSRMVNLDVIRLNIEYRVMDGWGNLSNIANRVVYIYESSQYDQYAFYATPMNGLENDPSGRMENYFNDGNSTRYLTSLRKDTDGDGISDYWEAIFETDPKVSDSSHSTPDWSTLNNVTPAVIRTRVQGLIDSSQLDDMNSNWISSSHILYGL
jgi:hypothetical protein